MTRATDTFLLTGLQFQQISAGRILVTPSGGTQTTLAAALSASGFANLNLIAILPTANPGGGRPWLNGNPTDGYVICVGP